MAEEPTNPMDTNATESVVAIRPQAQHTHPYQDQQPQHISPHHQQQAHMHTQEQQHQQQLLHQQHIQQQQQMQYAQQGMPGGGPRSPPGGLPASQRPVRPAPSKPKDQSQNREQLARQYADKFLEQVRSQFGQNSDTYTQFLDILKWFKYSKSTLDISGVVDRVKSLFKGHKSLILGFNFFLPPEHKIELTEKEEAEMDAYARANHLVTHNMPPSAAVPGLDAGGAHYHQTVYPGHPGHALSHPHQPHPLASPRAQQSQAVAMQGMGGMPPSPSQPSLAPPPPKASPMGGSASAGPAVKPQNHRQHAIEYVTKIKLRFATQPDVYKAFLDILHTYEKEQRSIDEVKEQVAMLFRGHEDLLGEFSLFLPDTAASATQQKGAQQQLQQRRGMPPKTMSKTPSKPVPIPAKAKPEPKMMERRPAMKRKKDEEGPMYKRADEPERERAQQQEDKQDAGFFDKVKAALDNKEQYQEVLKCLNLFNQDIISKNELIIMLQDILGAHQEFMDAFRRFLCLPLTDDNSRDELDPSELDLTHCVQYGPSYRALPTEYSTPRCSGRTKLCASVLNDVWVSVPSGSEDWSYKNMRKNQYEESLFKCEDDRFELDMVIESNATAIRVFETLNSALEELDGDTKGKSLRLESLIARLPDAERARHKIDKTLSVIHFRCVERLYGDHGPELCEMLRRSPAVAVPVILARMKQKDDEWRKARVDMNKIWREVYEKNYVKSLDHRSFYFKQMDKKALTPSSLIAEVTQAQHLKDLNGDESACRVGYPMEDTSIHADIHNIVQVAIRKSLSELEQQVVNDFWKHFVDPFFSLPRHGVTTVPDVNDWVSEGGKEEDKKKPAKKTEEVVASTSKRKGYKPKGRQPLSRKGNDDEDVRMDEDKESDRLQDDADGDGDTLDETSAAFLQPAVLPCPLPQPNVTTGKCKPVSIGTTGGTKSPTEPIFFGNTQCFLFFRLYQILYERLCKVKAMAAAAINSKRPPNSFGFAMTPPGIPNSVVCPPGMPAAVDGESTPTASNAEDTTPAPTPTPAGGKKANKTNKAIAEPERPDRPDPYQAFLSLLLLLLDTAVDTSTFEEQVRRVLGANSYVFFTMDKLLFKLVSQVQLIQAESSSRSLLALYFYETTRTSSFSENVYLLNVLPLLGEDAGFRFVCEKCDDQQRTLTISPLDVSYVAPLKAEARPLHAGLTSVLDAYLHHPMTASPFLARSLRAAKKASKSKKSLPEVHVSNTLALRMQPPSFRLRCVVEDSADFLWRSGPRPSIADGKRETKKHKFYAYWEKRRLGLIEPQATTTAATDADTETHKGVEPEAASGVPTTGGAASAAASGGANAGASSSGGVESSGAASGVPTTSGAASAAASGGANAGASSGGGVERGDAATSGGGAVDEEGSEDEGLEMDQDAV